MSEFFMYTSSPRPGVTYNTEAYAIAAAEQAVTRDSASRRVEVWKRIAVVEATAKVDHD